MANSRTEYQRQWYLKNREKKLEQSRTNYLSNLTRRREQIKLYHQNNPEVAAKAYKKYRSSHQELCRKRCRDWYSRNVHREHLRNSVKGKQYYSENRERLLKEGKLWRANNRAAMKSIWMKRRALLKGAAINLSKIKEWIAKVKSKPSARCYYCDSVVPIDIIHFDHIIALSKGGLHSVENLCVSCAPCNLSKKAKSIDAWVRVGQQILSL